MAFTTAFSSSFRLAILSAATAILGLAASCSYSHGDPAAIITPCDTSPQTVTYAGVISPIFDTHCRECHAASKASSLGGGINLSDYLNVSRYPADQLLASIQQLPTADPMPKGRAKIPECDILRIKAWMDAGEPNN